MTKRIKPNYKGKITFIEDLPIHPLILPVDEAVIFELVVNPELSDDFTEMFICFGLTPDFYLNKTDDSRDDHFIMSLKYNVQFLRHFHDWDGVKINCEIFKNSEFVHILGYFYPDTAKRMRNFYFHGDFIRMQI